MRPTDVRRFAQAYPELAPIVPLFTAKLVFRIGPLCWQNPQALRCVQNLAELLHRSTVPLQPLVPERDQDPSTRR